MTAAAPPIRFCGSVLRTYRHVCAFFQSVDDEYLCLLPFMRDGLAVGDRGVYVISQDREGHSARLRGAGVDVEAMEQSGQLEVLESEETYMRAGRFDQDRMLEVIRNILDAGRDRGFPLTRLIAHPECTVRDWEGANSFIQYESRLNDVLPSYPDVVICTYDLTKIGAGVAVDVLRTHPIAVIGGVLHENPFFVPPDELLREVRDRTATGDGSRAHVQ
jgi:MEDS: MEthanogen/methylotroph, DcmR Sensory domain